jgi:hypothetical protein
MKGANILVSSMFDADTLLADPLLYTASRDFLRRVLNGNDGRGQKARKPPYEVSLYANVQHGN